MKQAIKNLHDAVPSYVYFFASVLGMLAFALQKLDELKATL